MNILTFDIEDWFHIHFDDGFNNDSNLDRFESRIKPNVIKILESLECRNLKATFFCLGWVARKHPDVIHEITRHGHEIGSHSNNHNLAHALSRKEFEKDLKDSISYLQDISGQKITYYRAPAFSIKNENSWAFDLLIENGIEIDCSIFPSSRDFGGFQKIDVNGPFMIKRNGYTLKEFPINLYPFFGKRLVFSGGGYFRLLPSRFIRKAMTASEYVMTYFHPRDFDPDQPVLEGLSAARRFKSYYGLSNSFQKFEDLLDNFSFIDLNEANAQVNWQSVARVQI